MSDNTPPPPSNTQPTPSHPSRPSLCPLSFPNLQATPSPRRPYIQYLPPRLIAKPNGKIPSMRTTKVSKSAALILAFRAFDAGAFSARPTDHHHRTAPSVQASSHAPLPPPPPQTPPPQTPASTSSTDATRDDPHAVLGLDPTSSPPPGDFAEVQRAYRHLARRCHPDVAVGPDATPREREAANAYFARINEAYETLKSRRDEEEIEVVIMGGNFATTGRERLERRVTYKTSEKIRQANPNRVNTDRILELRDRGNLRGKNWSDPGEFEVPQGGRHNGDFGPPRRW